MSLLPHILFLVIFSSIIVSGLQADDASRYENVGIIGGHTVSIKDAPYIVALYQNDDGFCGGSIIHKRFILTAAHCVVGLESSDTLQVLVGSNQLNTGGVLIDVEEELCHEDYDYNEHDICLLKLKKPVRFGRKVAPVGLPDEGSESEDGLMVNVTGWGNTKCTGKRTKTLHQTMVPLVSDERCKEIYPLMIEGMLCAGADGFNFYYGDSGGPLTYNNIQIGVVSFFIDCFNPGFYTKVSTYVNWINTTIKENL